MSPLAKEDDSHRPKKKVSEVSVAAVWAWASPAAMETAWWAATSRKTVPSPPGGRRAAQSQSLRSGSLPRPGPPPLRCPVSRTSTKQSNTQTRKWTLTDTAHTQTRTCGDPAGVLSTEAEERLFLWTNSCFLLFLLRPRLFTPPSRLECPPGGRPTRLLFFFPQ